MMGIARSAVLSVIVFGVASPASLWAAAGDLDLGFGGVGSVTTPIGSGDDFAYHVALQPDGSLATRVDGDGMVTTAIGLGART